MAYLLFVQVLEPRLPRTENRNQDHAVYEVAWWSDVESWWRRMLRIRTAGVLLVEVARLLLERSPGRESVDRAGEKLPLSSMELTAVIGPIGGN